MGSVWVATHLLLDTPVAMKFMLNLAQAPDPPIPSAFRPDGEGVPPSSASVTSRERFDREAKAAAQIRSANVVQILDYGVDRGTPYIVMELLRGEDLGTRLKRLGRLPLEEVAGLVAAIARALQRAHDVGLVHRDLKPANVYLAREGDEIVPKVLDFGVAKVVQDRPVGEATIEGTLVGTPSYMSPEQAMGRSGVDHRSDLWSLAVIVYRCLTGDRPFQSDSFMELVVQICSHPWVPPSTLVSGLPPAIDAYFDRALQRDPNHRFQSAREMARALLAILPSRAGDLGPDSHRALADQTAPMPSLEAPEAATLAVTSPSGVSWTGTGPAMPSASSVTRQSLSPFAPHSSSPLALPTPPTVQGPGSSSGFVHLPPPPSVPSVPVMLAVQQPPSKSGVILAIAISFAALALAGALLFVRASRDNLRKLGRHAEVAAAVASSAPTPPVASAALPAPVASAPPATTIAEPVPTASAAPSAFAPASASSSASASAAKARAPKAAAPAKHADCSSPYYWDSSGTKFIKPECL
jgi:serine/threonine-protein kinase